MTLLLFKYILIIMLAWAALGFLFMMILWPHIVKRINEYHEP